MHRHPHLLNAASNLLGVCFVVIGALKLTHSNAQSYADEVAWGSAVFFLLCICTSYWAIRRNETNRLTNLVADGTLFAAISLLSLSVVIAATLL